MRCVVKGKGAVRSEGSVAGATGCICPRQGTGAPRPAPAYLHPHTPCPPHTTRHASLTLLVLVVADGDGAVRPGGRLHAHVEPVEQVGAELGGALAQVVVKHLAATHADPLLLAAGRGAGRGRRLAAGCTASHAAAAHKTAAATHPPRQHPPAPANTPGPTSSTQRHRPPCRSGSCRRRPRGWRARSSSSWSRGGR